MSRSSKRLEAWETNRGAFTVLLARIAIPFAEIAYGIMKLLHTGEKIDKLGEIPPLLNWRKFYEKKINPLPSILDTYFRPLFGGKSNSEFFNSLFRWIDEQPPEEWPRKLKSIPRIDSDFENHIDPQLLTLFREAEQLRNAAVRNLPVPASGAAGFTTPQYLTPEAHFFFRVYIPCGIQTRNSVFRVLEKARQGGFGIARYPIAIGQIIDSRSSDRGDFSPGREPFGSPAIQ